MRLNFSQASFQEWLESHPLRDHFVHWDVATSDQVEHLKLVLGTATNERDLQVCLERNPVFLIHQLRGGHGRFVIPQVRLGSRYVADFIVGEASSLGYEWYLVELESPTARPFRRDGGQSAALTHAIGQIQSWRTWLGRNRDNASRPRAQDGLGLVDIEPSPDGIILIGRRAGFELEQADIRRRLKEQSRISVRSYDYLLPDDAQLEASASQERSDLDS